MIGQSIGSYQILSKLGAGGMGEVYRARDKNLNRDVAIKVLPKAFALDADRLARFTREAQVLASLNHPNIAGIYGIEEKTSEVETTSEVVVRALVMELVEGRDLSEVIAGREHSTGIPLSDALAIARQIADALEAAHEQGIIHRDLKPQNIKVRADGTVKVLDFGLAKAAGAPGSEDPGLRGDVANSPTLTAAAFAQGYGGPGTELGMILGTAAYMAPEQARGRAVDRRADIWAFGVVLYEMLTGRRAFEGEDISVTLANVIKETPTFDALPPDVPASVRRLLRRCLEKDPKRRLSSIGDARLEFDDAAESSEALPASSPERAPARSSTLPWGIAGALAVALAAVAVWLWPQPAPTPDAMQFTIDPPAGTTFTSASGFLSLSPDGRQVAFTTGPANDAQLWIRPLDALNARQVSTAAAGWHVTWSPDMQSVVFPSTTTGLARLDLGGGPVRILTDDATERAAWNRDDTIVFTQRSSPQRLMRMAATGGAATPVTELNGAAGELSHYWPVFLPDGKRFIFLARNRDRAKSALFLASLDSLERTPLLDVHSMAEVVPGFLLYHRGGTVYAHPFDESSARLTGTPLPIVSNVQFNDTNGRAAFAASRTGHLIYRSDSGQGLATLSWLDRSGKIVATVGQPARYDRVALAPDGRRLVAVRNDAYGGNDLVMIDVARNITSQFTTDPTARENGVLWSPDGESVIFSSNRKGPFDLYIKNAGGAIPERLLLESTEDKFPSGVSPDGRLLLFSEGQGTARRTWVLPLAAKAKPYRAFPDESEIHINAQFSPDGQWIAYQAGDRSNVFVQPFPPTGYREQISATFGVQPRWTADGKQIAFIGPNDNIMIADVTPAGGTLRVSAPRELFTQRQTGSTLGFVTDARAERFLMVVPPSEVGQTSEAPLTVIVNWRSLAIKK